MHVGFGAVAFLLAAFSFFDLAHAVQDDPLETRLQEAVDKAVSPAKMPGLVAAILMDGKLHCNVSSGLRRVDETENPITVDDKLHLGSCTKAMTATLVGILVDEGKLNWDDTIAERLPEIAADVDKEYRDVTLWQLMTHRGGVKANHAAWTNQGVNTHENRMQIARLGLQLPPDDLKIGEFHYSNLGYMIVGLFAESATDESWETLIQEKLFDPLEMRSAGFGAPCKTRPAEHPWGHMKAAKKLNPSSFDNPPSIAPAGAVHCSIGDWARFVALHLDLECRNHQLLEPATLTRLHTPFDGNDPKYSAGWIVDAPGSENYLLAHSGSNTFWYSTVRACPGQQAAVLIVTNGPLASVQRDVENLSSKILEWLSDEKD